MKNPLFVFCMPVLAAGSLTLSIARADEPFVEQVEVLNIQFEPVGQPINAGDGFFYGAAGWSDTARGGVLYRFAPGQDAEVLYTFESLVEAGPNLGGSNPRTPLILGPDGAYYGVTSGGGANARGTIYRFSQDGVYSVLHHLNPATEGAEIFSLISTPQGDLFGATNYGGLQGGGTLFRLSLDGVYETVYSFTSAPSAMDPNHPAVLPASNPLQLAVGMDGKIYGSTMTGGPAELIPFAPDNSIENPTQPFLNLRYCYGSFFRYDGPNAITELGQFDSFKEHCGPLTATADGFYTTTGNSGRQLLHITFDGTIALKADFKQMVEGRLGVTPPIIVNDKAFGVSTYGGTEDAGFIYRHTPGAQTEIIYEFGEEYAERRKWIVEGNDGMIYGLAALPQTGITAAEQERIANSGKKKKQPRRNPDDLPRAFRYRETAGASNFVPAARPDVAWLPALAGKSGIREIVIDVLANDADAEKDKLVIESVEGSGATIVSTPKGQRIQVTTSESDPSSSLFTYHVSDGKGGEATGQLCVKAPLTGSFTGTVSGEGVASTPVTVTLGKKNSVTATAVINGKKFTGKGSLDVDDSADVTLKAKGQPSVSLHLGILRDGPRKVTATLVNQDLVSEGTFTPKVKK